jgi:hypothetical protein
MDATRIPRRFYSIIKIENIYWMPKNEMEIYRGNSNRSTRLHSITYQKIIVIRASNLKLQNISLQVTVVMLSLFRNSPYWCSVFCKNPHHQIIMI